MLVRTVGAAEAAVYPQRTHPGIQKLLPASLEEIYARGLARIPSELKEFNDRDGEEAEKWLMVVVHDN